MELNEHLYSFKSNMLFFKNKIVGCFMEFNLIEIKSFYPLTDDRYKKDQI
jgi:hypothetical protein